MTVEERIDRLTAVVESLAGSVVAHDNVIEAHDRQIDKLVSAVTAQNDQIQGLVRAAEAQGAQIEGLIRATANLERQWQTYLNTLPRQ